MRAPEYAALIRRYRDTGPDPSVHHAYVAGMNNYPRRWLKGTKGGAAFVAGRINRRAAMENSQ